MVQWLAAAAALAEDPTFTGADAARTEEPESHLTGELGGSLATGNSVFYTVNGLVNGSHQWRRNKLSLVGGVNLGAAVQDVDGNGIIDDYDRGKAPDSPENAGLLKSAERVYADARYDRFVTERSSLYGLVGGYRDLFAGYELRTHEQVGYSRLLVETEPTELRAEIGFDWAQENYGPVDVVDPVTLEVVGTEEPETQQVLAVRALLAVSHQFTESVGVGESFEIYENVLDLEDVRILNTVALTSSLSKRLSIKLSHALIFDNVPVEGFGPVDQTSMITFVATVL